MRYWVRKRCQKFNDPEVNLKSMTPLEQWELGMMSLYDITVPESIMNWTGNVDQSDPEPESSSGSESGTESEADEPPATTSSPTPPRLPNSRFQDAVLLHCFSAFPQACPPRVRDDRWNRFVDILNLLGPPATSIEWKAVRFGPTCIHSLQHAQCINVYSNLTDDQLMQVHRGCGHQARCQLVDARR